MRTESLSRIPLAQVAAAASRREEPLWLLERRQAAWERFQQEKWPVWRRTSLKGIDLDAFVPLPEDAEAELPEALREALSAEGAYGGLLVRANNRVVDHRLDPELSRRGVIFADLGTALREHPEVVERYLYRALDEDDPRFGRLAALHTALWSGGLFLYVPRGVEVEVPLRSLLWVQGDGEAVFPHLLLVAEDRARVTLIHEYASDPAGGAFLSVGAVEAFVGRGAQLTFVSLQNWSDQVLHFAPHRALVQRDGQMRWVSGTFGGRLVKAHFETALLGEGSHGETLACFFGAGRQHMDLYTLSDHRVPNTGANVLVKGALTDRARAVYEGLIVVRPGAQKTDSYLSDHVLLLSSEARSDSIPSLEIEADDVRASHGATAGPVDPELIFYLQTRGIPYAQALRMVVEGFFAPVLDGIPVEPLRERALALVARKLEREG